jgi:hypothetical protein
MKDNLTIRLPDMDMNRKEFRYRIVASIIAGAAAGFVGRGSPGLAGIVMFGALGCIAFRSASKTGTGFWQVLLWLAILHPTVVAPTRLVGVAFREFGAVAWHLEAIMQALVVFWMTLGAACLTVKVFAKPQPISTKT